MLKAHRYKIAIVALLVFASLLSVGLYFARASYSGSRQYFGLVWNLMLAWIPFGLAILSYALAFNRRTLVLLVPGFALLWLLFFPNAPYILTDFQHLGDYSHGVPVWFDVILLLWFSWTGMLLAVVSLNLMQEIVRIEFGRAASWLLVASAASLSAIGLYIGRFIRLNSWDVFQAPEATAANLLDWLTNPGLRSLGFILLYTAFFLFVYVTVHAFAAMLREGTARP